jgi:hypothetical protein
MAASLWIFVPLLLLINVIFGWPDGAPCIHAAYESMNPLEAVEHQGGLQLTEPPFSIEVDRKCYWLNQPIGLTLKGNTTKTKFKGFQIQPIVWKGNKFGQRQGEFLRLDDNGSWQLQCFRKKDSVTHSHDEPKTNMKMWWKSNDDDTQYIQFVATVVVNLKKFWVKSVVSPPLPPCKVEREVGPWAKPILREPPPVNQFKMDTWRIFNHESAGTFPRSIASFNEEDGSFKVSAPRRIEKPFTAAPRTEKPFVPVFISTTSPRPTPTPFQNPPFQGISGDVSMNRQPPMQVITRPPPTPPPTSRPVFQLQPSQAPQQVIRQQPQQQPQPQRPQPQMRQRLTHVIPLENMEINRRTPNPVPSFSPPVTAPRLVTIAPSRTPMGDSRMIAPQQQQTQFQQAQIQRMMAINRQIAFRRQQQQQQRQLPQPLPCMDRDPPNRCFSWISYCGSSAYMEINCRRTCRFC